MSQAVLLLCLLDTFQLCLSVVLLMHPVKQMHFNFNQYSHLQQPHNDFCFNHVTVLPGAYLSFKDLFLLKYVQTP